jgi:uncharacterized protein
MVDLPELGVGIVYTPGLQPLLEAGQNLIDVIEIEPQPFWLKSPASDFSYRLNVEVFESIQNLPQRKIVHGVGFPIGGTAPLDPKYLASFIEVIHCLESPWVSEHLSFNQVKNSINDFNTGFLLPPLQSMEGVSLAASNIKVLSAHLPVPFAFETGVNYLQPQPGELSDGRFLGSVAEEADCGILLDLHNLWANEQNGRQPVLDTIAEMPLERVWEVHLAGGEFFHDYWLDAHSDLVPEPVMKLAGEIIPYLPNLKAIVFEIIDTYVFARPIKTEVLLEQIEQIHELWNHRSHEGCEVLVRQQKEKTFTNSLPLPIVWEEALGKLVIGRQPDQPLSLKMANDPGVNVLKQLVSTARAGTIASSLPFTCRFLMLTLGEEGFRDILKSFWQSKTPELFASEEAQHFGIYLKALALNIPYLEDVLESELASLRVILEGTAQTIRFSCDPIPLLQSLGEGHLPEVILQGEYELVINPSSGIFE